MSNRKPARWALTPGLVAPEWGWFFKGLRLAAPLWEGGGGVITPSRALRGIDGSSITLTGLDWVGTSRGMGLDLADDGDYFDITDHLDFTNSPMGTNGFSFFFYGDVDSYDGTNAGFFRTNATGSGNTFFITNAGGGLWLRVNGIDFIKNSFTLDTGPVSYGCSYKTTDQRVFMNGVQRGSNTSGGGSPTGANAQVHHVGYQSSTAQKINGRWLMFAFWDRDLTDAEHAQLARDPFGPFRMVDEAPLFVGVTIVELAATIAAAGSLTTTLSVTRSLNSIIAATGSLTSALQLINGLYAALSSTGAIAANLDNQSGLYSAIAGLSNVFGGASVARDIAAVISAVSSYQASIDSQSGLYSDIAATSTINAKINSLKDLDSLIASVSTVSGKIGCIVNIDGTILSTSTVAGAVSLIRSLDSLLPATSTVAGNLSRMVSLAVVIPGVSTIVADLFVLIGEKRGFISLDNVEQYHISHDNVSQYHISKSDVSQYHVGLADEFT